MKPSQYLAFADMTRELNNSAGWWSDIVGNKKGQYALLLGITLLAAVLRFYKLGQWSFWFDEIFFVNRVLSHYSTLGDLVQNVPPNEFWFPISLVSTGGIFTILGDSEWSARLASAIIGIISIPILYFPIRRLFGASVALLAALLLAIAPWHIFWSQNARYYSSLFLLYSLSLLAFFYGIEKDRSSYLLASLLLLYLAVSERLVALFLIPVAICYILALILFPFEKPPGLRKRNLLILLLAGIAFIGYEIYTYLSANDSFLLDAYRVFSVNRGPDIFRMIGTISFNIGIPLICMATFAGIFLLLRRGRIGLYVTLSAVVPIIILLLLNPFIFTDERYVFTTLLSWIILGAIAVKEMYAQARGRGVLFVAGIVVVFLVSAAYSDFLYFRVNNGDRLDWRRAFDLIQEKSEEDDLVVSYWPHLATYYSDREVVSLRDMHPSDVMERGQESWFVIDKYATWSAPRMSNWIEQNGDLIEVLYLRQQRDWSLRIYRFDPLKH